MAWSSSSNTPQEKHEVFLSFKSEDTRRTFTSHLNGALRRLDIRTYTDDNNIERGDEISATLLRAVEEAKLSVIVFSKNYAASKWCLDELMTILECRKSRGQIIVPVFYDIDPSHVRNQKGRYAEAFANHERDSQEDMNKVRKWRDALVEAANHWLGLLRQQYRTEFEIVEEIAMDVLQKLSRVYVGDLDQQIAKYEQFAQLQHQYFRSIASRENWNNHRATLQRIT